MKQNIRLGRTHTCKTFTRSHGSKKAYDRKRDKQEAQKRIQYNV